MVKITIANEDEYITVRDFYYSLIDATKDAEYKSGWKKDVYPTKEFLADSIKNAELYIAKEEENTVACMVVNHKYNEGYKAVKWSVDAADSEILVIHALGVHPAYSGRGIAKIMVRKVIDYARANKIKTVRLDVLSGNIPAEQVYVKMGFVYRGTVKMFYEDTGLTDYKLFEYIV